jgi:uncharacterized repeat protein (TIGR01451 family)
MAILSIVSMMAAPVTAQPLTGSGSVPAQRPVRGPVTPADLQEETLVQNRPDHGGLSARDIANKYGALGETPVVILVQLSEPDVVNYTGGINGMAASAATEGQPFNAQSSAAQAYMAYLVQQQDAFVSEAAQVNPAVESLYNYTAALNGVAIKVPASAVDKISRLPGVLAVYENTIAHPDTDRGPTWIGAPAVWAALGGQDMAGEDVVVGVLDTGAWSPNPITPTLLYTQANGSYASDASVVGGAYAFPFTSVSGVTYTEHLGVCNESNPATSDDTFVCTDKLIGGWWYSLGGSTRGVGEGYDSPLDRDGHGTHTSTTAAGNTVTVTAGSTQLMISGVAPRARIIMYKTCWDEDPDDPDDGGCAFVDTTAAVNQAILDGVNVINYSIGGGTSVGGDTDLAFLSARAAGIFVSASAGNDGPTPGTAEHISPWVSSSAAMDHDRDFHASLVLTSTFTTSMPTDLEGASATGAYTGTIILAPLQTGETVLPSLCNEPYAPGTFANGEIVVCRRGIDPRIEKGYNVLQGGAGGYVLVNAAANQGLALDPHWLPAVHLEYNATAFSEAGENLVTYLKAAVVASATVTATITGGAPVARQGDVMAAFSSRGPTGINIIKPDLASPGTAIFAGTSPDKWASYEPDGSFYQFQNGTSMASPHTAGAGALLKALHPDWTPVRIQSALMTGGVQIVKEDATTPATPFDQGSGRINLATSMEPGVVFDIPQGDYTQVLSGTKAIETLNYPSMANVLCVQTCSWVRTATSVMTTTATYTWRIDSATTNLVVSLDSPTYTVGAGASQVFTVTADVSALPNNGQYAFARVVLHETTTGVEVVLPVAVIPSFGTVPAALEFEVNRNAGSYLLKDVTAVEITDLTTRSYGLVKGAQTTQSVIEDPTNGNPYDNIGTGSFYVTYTVPADAVRFVAQVAATTASDVDMFIGIDLDGDGPELSEELDTVETGAALEYYNLEDPAPGVYWVLAMNWEAGSAPDPITLSVAAVPNSDAGNMDVTGPAAVSQLDPFDLRIFWDEPTMAEGDIWYGVFDLGTDSGDPGNISKTDIDIHRVADDVTKTASTDTAQVGDIVTYTITINPNVLPEDVTYMLTDTIPAGLTYVSGTVTGGASVVGNQVTWNGVMDAPQGPTYEYTTSDDDASCGVPLANSGAYTNLRGYGINPQSTIIGDTESYFAFATGTPFEYWGNTYTGTGIDFTDDGFAFFDSDPGAEPWVNTDLPNTDVPNNTLAMMWRDMEIIYATNPVSRGVSLASLGGSTLTPLDDAIIVEYDDMQLYDDPSVTLDFELFMWRLEDGFGPGAEIIFAYDNISGTLDVGSVGLENVDGTQGVQYAFDDAPLGDIHNGMAICFNYYQPVSEPVVITYQAQVDGTVTDETLTNNAATTTDNPGSHLESVSAEVYVPAAGVVVTPPTAAQTAAPGTTLTYTLWVTNTGSVTDTFDVSVNISGTAFTTTAPSTVGPLAAGAGTSLDVTVVVPAGAADAAVSAATVTVTSQGNSAAFDSAMLTTTVAWHKLYLPIIWKDNAP